MTSSLNGKKIVILTANGCDESAMTASQRAFIKAGVRPVIVAVEQGLVNTWSGVGFGLNFPIDQHVSATLAADMDMLVILSGERANNKLVTSLHSERIVKGFLDGKKPIAAFGNGVELFALTGLAKGLTVSGPESSRAKMEEAGAVWAGSQSQFVSGMVLTGSAENAETFVEEMITHFVGEADEVPLAA